MEAFVIVLIIFVVIVFLFLERKIEHSHTKFSNQIKQKIKFHTELIFLCERAKVLLVSGTLRENKTFIKQANVILAKRP